MINVCLFDDAHCKVEFGKVKGLLAPPLEFDLSEFVEIANPKAVGKKITADKVKEIRFISLDPEEGLDEIEAKPVFKTTLF